MTEPDPEDYERVDQRLGPLPSKATEEQRAKRHRFAQAVRVVRTEGFGALRKIEGLFEDQTKHQPVLRSVLIQQFREDETWRLETGLIQFEDDRRGLFIRADHALRYAAAIRTILKQADEGAVEMGRWDDLEKLADLLETVRFNNALIKLFPEMFLESNARPKKPK